MKLKGLNEQQVLESRMNFGSNKLPAKPLKKWHEFFLETFQDRLNLILLGMMIVFALLAIFGEGSISEPIGVGCVLVAIAIINVITGMKSQKRTKELRDKTSIRFCNVVRDGEVKEINTDDLVVGDVVILQSGEGVYADGYLIEGHLKVDNSALNGESEPCKKTAIDTAPYDAKTREPSGDDYVDQHSLFAGALVVEGEGKMVVTNVGIGTDQYPGTVNGKTITSIDEIEQQKTSLEIQLDDLAGQISKFGYVGASIIIAVLLGSKILELGGFAEFFDLGALNIFQEILTAVVAALTIIVAAVPEGLPLIISLITAQNARVMIKNNVLAKNTNKIPEAGNIQLLCTDKTGTLTGGKLVPVYVINGNGDIIDKNDYQNYFIAENVVLNSSCIRNNPDEYIGGNITDRALSSLASFDSYNFIKKKFKLVDKKEFNSAWKYSAIAVDNGIEGMLEIVRTFYKGAPEIIINKCSTYIADDSYNQVPLDKEKILAEIKKYTKQAMRVIALAYAPKNTIGDEISDGLTLSALVAIRDDVRPEVPEAVRKVQEAGVQVMMITGDVIDTAVAIATDCGIYRPNTDDLAFTAKELDNLDDEMVKGILKHIKIIARATPMTKLRIVKLAQECNICCSMTGDGVNDSPALKGADVGFAMGSGSDVAKEAGDIIITDDNFVSIANAVLLGRTFMHNVMKFLKFQLPINIGLVLLSILYPIILGTEALIPVQILVVNIVMDTLNSLSFGGEPAKEEYMHEKPIPKGSKLLSKETINQIAVSVVGFIAIFLLTLIPAINSRFSVAEYSASRFALLIFVATINGFNIRTDGYNLFKGITKNPLFIGIALLIFGMTFVLTQYGNAFMGCVFLSAEQWLIIVGLSLLIIPIDLLRKYILKKGETK